MSPFSGKLVDKTGQRPALLLSGTALFTGYYGLHLAYVGGWDHSAGLLCVFSFLTGVGSSLGNSAALNACAKSYPHNRGTATAFPVAAYGLSAFVFSRISYTFFVGRTDKFLLALAISCGSAQIISSCFIGVFEHSQLGITKTKNDPNDTDESGTLLLDDQSDLTSEDELQAEVIAEVTGLALFRTRDFQLMIITIALRKCPVSTSEFTAHVCSKWKWSYVHQQSWQQSDCIVSGGEFARVILAGTIGTITSTERLRPLHPELCRTNVLWPRL